MIRFDCLEHYKIHHMARHRFASQQLVGSLQPVGDRYLRFGSYLLIEAIYIFDKIDFTVKYILNNIINHELPYLFELFL